MYKPDKFVDKETMPISNTNKIDKSDTHTISTLQDEINRQVSQRLQDNKSKSLADDALKSYAESLKQDMSLSNNYLKFPSGLPRNYKYTSSFNQRTVSANASLTDNHKTTFLNRTQSTPSDSFSPFYSAADYQASEASRSSPENSHAYFHSSSGLNLIFAKNPDSLHSIFF